MPLSAALPAALLLWLRLALPGSAALVVPGWNATMPHTEHCIAVPDCDAASHCVHNNSRWAFVSLPKEGAAPASGWPVLIQLAIIDFAAANASIEANGGQCGLDGVIPFPKGGPGFRRRAEEQEDEDDGRPPGRHGFGITEEYQPFATPEEMMSPCSCFAPDGIYNCSTTADNGHHMSPGAGCSFDILAGGMWLQRQKQYLLANGVAVMTVNARTFDGWDIDNPSFDGHAQAPAGSNPFESTAQGADKPFFEALSKDMASGKLGALDPSRVAFHGWSGGAQMVSELADVWARGELPGITMKAGVMMSGGSQQCYNWLPNTTMAQCKGCDPDDSCMTPGCSGSGGPPKPPGTQGTCCNMCCPQGVTEKCVPSP